LVWLEYFLQYKKTKNCTDKKVKKLQKLTKEVRKKYQNRKKQRVYLYVEKYRMCTQKIWKSKCSQKI